MEEAPVEVVNLQYIENVHPTSGSKSENQFSLIYKESIGGDASKSEAYQLKVNIHTVTTHAVFLKHSLSLS